MTDIVERLRIGRETCGVDMCRIREAKSGCTCAEAADEIERLREALQEIANIKISPDDGVNKYIVFSARTTARVAIGATNYE